MWVIKKLQLCTDYTPNTTAKAVGTFMGNQTQKRVFQKFVQALLREKMSQPLQSRLGEGLWAKIEKDMAITQLTYGRKRKKGMGWKETERHSETQSWVQDTQREEKELPLPVKWLCYSNQNSRRQREYISFTVLKRNQGQGSPTFLTSPSQHPVSQASHLSQISLCSLVKGFTALTCSLESSLLAYSMRRRIHSFPSAVTPWMCFPLKAAVFAVSPRTGRVFNVWSNLQRNISHHVTVRGTKWPAPIFQNNSHQQSTLIPELWLITAAQIVPSFQPTHVAKLVV